MAETTAFYPSGDAGWTNDQLRGYDGAVNNKDVAILFQHLSGWDVEIY